jgi:DNA-binding response OmpR family regulator
MKRIVIVEDHPVLISIYRNKFIAEGFEVEIATDGESGLQLIYSTKPNLVVLDLAMPKLNGIEVLKRLRANRLFKALPVVIFSDSAWKQQAWKEGATVVISKSTHGPSEVVEAVRNALLGCEAQQLDESIANFLAGATVPTEMPIQSSGTEGQVLLVEDHHDIRTTISSALIQSGFRVTGVESHAAAFHQQGLNSFDAFLLNRVCPDGIGLALCRQLRTAYPITPIVMYSTAALPIAQEQRIQAGASAYLTDAGEILNPTRILLKLLHEAKSTSHFGAGVKSTDFNRVPATAGGPPA